MPFCFSLLVIHPSIQSQLIYLNVLVLILIILFQYEGDDEEVDVEKVDSEMLDIDINSEVDIEQV